MESRHNDLLKKLEKKDKIKVLFVCLGNICRSPAAEGVLREIVDNHNESYRWEIDSAGTGRYHIGDLPDRRMRVHASRRGLNLTHRCRQVCVSDFNEFDLIIPMDSNNEERLREISPTSEDEKKIIPMAQFLTIATRYDYIPDPYYEGSEGFELVLDLLDDGCNNLFNRLQKK